MSDVRMSEIFYAIQGEGPYAGKPAIFIRLAGCVPPLCPYCDTKYAWDAGMGMTYDEVLQRIRKASYAYTKLVVVTGGEPFAQEGSAELIKRLLEQDYAVQVETSGKCLIPKLPETVTIVCSPKILDGALCIRPGFQYNLVHTFKVIFEESTFPTFWNYVRATGIRKAKIMLMPLGATREEQIREMPRVLEECLRRKLRFSPRLHILAYDTKRGV